jgi:hypothetical protein
LCFVPYGHVFPVFRHNLLHPLDVCPYYKSFYYSLKCNYSST